MSTGNRGIQDGRRNRLPATLSTIMFRYLVPSFFGPTLIQCLTHLVPVHPFSDLFSKKCDIYCNKCYGRVY